jgi:UDP-N-acetylmuramoyl-tripeptide--D-alanyl-D-alanine ligase
VADTVVALSALARRARERVQGGVMGVTGSVGKTTVKDMAAAAVRSTFTATVAEKSFNNEIGVPLTLVNGPDGSEVAVIEMGSRGIGHIADLCAIARPTVGVVTRVAPAHLELFGTIDEVAKGKGELVEALPSGGTAVLNADDVRVAAMASRTSAAVLTYGSVGDVRAEAVNLDELARARFTVRSPWGSAPVRLAQSGEHMVPNALAALAAAVSLGVELATATEALATMRPSAWRMEVSPAPAGFVVVNDAYNASPVAMEAAFAAVARMAREGRARLALLGPMAELGDGSEEAHRQVAVAAARLGIRVVAVGTDRYGPGIEVVADHDAALAVTTGLGEGDVVLVKASRVAGLERLAQRLAGAGA